MVAVVDTAGMPHPSRKQARRLLDRYLPRELLGKNLWEHRMEAIAAFERPLWRQGTVVLKFFLHVSKAEQKRRFLERLEDKDKHWKFSASDLTEREFWDDYQRAYQEAIVATAAQKHRGSSCPRTTSGSPGSSSWRR